MTYTTFSTDNADYVLQLGNHIIENRQVDIFEGIDALVIETGDWNLEDCVKISGLQYKLPVKYCKDHIKPLFGTDVKITDLGLVRDLYSDLLGLPLSLPEWGIGIPYTLFSDKRANDYIINLSADCMFLLQELVVEGRNAFNARKIEEFVAPLLAERVGRKPYLGLIFGAANMGLKPDLQSKRRRDFTIWNWRNFNFRKWAGFVKEDLNRVEEAIYNDGEWLTTTYNSNLFNL